MKNIKNSVLKLFILILAVMCFSGCVVVNYFDLNKFKPADSQEIFEFEFDTDEDSVEIMETISLNLNASVAMSVKG